MKTFSEISRCRLFNEQEEDEPMGEVKTFDCPTALKLVLEGKKVSRKEWSKFKTSDYLMLGLSGNHVCEIIDGHSHYPSLDEIDLFAKDWFLVED